MINKNPIKKKTEIISKLTKNKRTIRNFGVKRIGLFGSVVNGDVKSGVI